MNYECFLRSFSTGKISYALVRKSWSRFKMERRELTINSPCKSSPTSRSVPSSCGRKISKIKISPRWVEIFIDNFFLSPSLSIRFAFVQAENYFIDSKLLDFFHTWTLQFYRRRKQIHNVMLFVLKWDAPHIMLRYMLEVYASFTKRDIRSISSIWKRFKNTKDREEAAAKKQKEFSYKRYNKIVYETCDPKKKCLFNSSHNIFSDFSRVESWRAKYEQPTEREEANGEERNRFLIILDLFLSH